MEETRIGDDYVEYENLTAIEYYLQEHYNITVDINGAIETAKLESPKMTCVFNHITGVTDSGTSEIVQLDMSYDDDSVLWWGIYIGEQNSEEQWGDYAYYGNDLAELTVEVLQSALTY